ncbi:MAG TPA: aspartate kinase [Caldithrix abyssi]|uniref:Aspartokinase n=1 Tax=Caldithrix abyssi TaxID=187145 RepID=A0A7V5H441_CALAY|nr:aspartate kinase [Caldithrix abyssi]
MKILKFGGTSLQNANRVNQTTDIIRQRTENDSKLAVVVSAFAGVTDLLISAAQNAAAGDESYKTIVQTLEDIHLNIAQKSLSVQNQSRALAKIVSSLNDLHDVLHGVFLVRELSARVLDFVMSFGERLSAFIVTEVLKEKGVNAEYLDARQVIKTNDHFGQAAVLWDETNEKIQRLFKNKQKLLVITGFIASTKQNETTTLGRSGSDFTASIFGAALDVEEIQIWTDVDGVMTADPRKVPSAFSIPQITYEEAMELSHFGAQVIHPRTMQPALEKKIPIRIKNTLNPQHPGTVISDQSNNWPWSIRGLTSLDSIALVSVIGSGMIGVTGIAGRVFSALAREKINIILISQASSEHSICFAVLPEYSLQAKNALEKELKLELIERTVNKVIVEDNLSIIAVVGEKMRRTRGIAGKVFSSLGQHGINIVAIAQGSSERNISFVIDRKDLTNALNAIHSEFFKHQAENNREVKK